MVMVKEKGIPAVVVRTCLCVSVCVCCCWHFLGFVLLVVLLFSAVCLDVEHVQLDCTAVFGCLEQISL